MNDALIGSTGFVGSVLLRQRGFQHHFRSTNISESSGRAFETVVCSAAPAQKWIANREPEADRANIDALCDNLALIDCKTFILISTVDVFMTPIGVDERSPIVTDGLHAYGLNRYRLEQFVSERFDNHLVVRLPGLVGPGLRKNVIFDFLNDNGLDSIDSRALFQFYPMTQLWYDIQIALENELRLVHLTAEPISVSDVSRLGFGRAFEQKLDRPVPSYDFRSCHADLFGGWDGYQYSKRETIAAVRAYAQSEPRTKKSGDGR